MGNNESLVGGPHPAESQWDFLVPDVSMVDLQLLAPVPFFIAVLWLVWTMFWLVGLITFLIRLRAHDSCILMRAPTLVVISALGAEAAFTCTAVQIALTRERYSCAVDTLHIVVLLPLYFVPFVLRFVCCAARMHYMERDGAQLRMTNMWINESTYVALLGMIMGTLVGVAAIIQFRVVPSWVACYGCEWRAATFWVTVCLVVMGVASVLINLFFLKGLRDPFKIKTELVACFTVWVVALAPYVGLYGGLPSADEYLGLLMFVFMATGYFSSVVWPLYQSFRAPPAEGAQPVFESMEDLLKDAEAKELVKQVARRHVGLEMLECLDAVEEYRAIEDDDRRRAEARRIFDDFIRPGARRVVNLGAEMVADVERRLASPTSDLFYGVCNQLVKLLGTNFLPEVKQMPEYESMVKTRQASRRGREFERRVFEGAVDGALHDEP